MVRTEKIFAHLNLDNIHMEEPDWVVLETPLLVTSKAFPRAGRHRSVDYEIWLRGHATTDTDIR